MTTNDERRALVLRCRRIAAAIRAGDLEGLLSAVDDPGLVPNGFLGIGIGTCLVAAIYQGPLAFVRTLLELGADPDAAADDGFPPLIAALSCTHAAPGATPRTDVDELLRLLLSFGADPNQRGINDYTPLHMAVAESNPLAVQILLDAGADPELRTCIDRCETPLEMARVGGLTEIEALLTRKRPLSPQRLRPGLRLLTDVPGGGEPVRRQHRYLIRLRLWLDQGDPVRWQQAWGRGDVARLEDDGATLVTELRIDRRSLVNGLFYGIDGMRVGGMRRLEIAPHLAYGDAGVPGVIPAGAVLTAEITILDDRSDHASSSEPG